jgi:hypothetical protein
MSAVTLLSHLFKLAYMQSLKTGYKGLVLSFVDWVRYPLDQNNASSRAESMKKKF